MRRSVLVCVIIISVMLSGCGSSVRNESLLAADAVIEENPDSAMAILSRIPYSDILGDGDRAFYNLLYNQAKYKLHRHASTEDLNFCVDYYRKHYNPELLQRSYYYRAAISEDNGKELNEFINDYKEAEKLITEKSETNIVYRIYNSMACVNLDNEDNAEAEYFARKGLIAARRTNDYDKIVNSYNVMMSVMRILQKTDSVEFYINKSLRLLYKCTDEEKSYLYNNIAGFYEKTHNDKKTAEDYYILSIELANNESSLLSLALLYLEQERYVQARKIADKLAQSPNTEFVGLAYDILSEICFKNGDYLQAYKTVNISDSILYSMKTFEKEIEIKEIQKKYDYEILKSKHKKYRAYVLIVILSIIIVSLFSIVVVLIMIRYKEQRIRKLELNLSELNKLTENLKNDKEKTIKEKVTEYGKIVRRKQVVINELEKELSKAARERNENVKAIKELKSYMEILFYVMNNEDGVLADKESRMAFITCYKNIDESFVMKIENMEVAELSVQEKLLSILYRIDKTPNEIKVILGLSNDAYRQLKSRTLRKLKSEGSFKSFCDNIC